ncbi:uncharacterized protein LOC135638644 [Musa acuminata AAA Group]|uniref:uncharacterized protein LOC135638644 n=1 Tax=Musa acuminata AAA Group TaxID=214697 RepID=UPI0031D27D9B
MTSSPPSSSSFSHGARERCPPPSPVQSSDGEAAWALEALMWSHDLDSTVGGSLLRGLRERYSISEDYILSMPEPGQRAYDPVPKGFALTLDALEAGLRLPLQPLIMSCISFWRISSSQVAPNSWRYLVVFLGECHYASITPSLNLFLSCYRLSKGPGGYFLSARTGFRVGGAPSNNKGWKGRFFYVSCVRDWGFGVRWSARAIDNTVPSLSEAERRDLGRLKEVLPSSQAIQNMTELWLVEAGLSPTPLGGQASQAPPPTPSADPKDAPLEVKAGRPRKKEKTAPSKGAEAGPRRGELQRRAPPLGRGGPSRGRPKAVATAEKRAADSEAEVARLRSELEASKNSNKELQKTIRVERTELRLLTTEAGSLSKKLEEAQAQAKARAASEALAEEARLRPDKDKELIVTYKKSEGFELGLTRTGQVSFEYGYRIATSRFRARHPGLEVEEDPFTPHPEDLEVDMPKDVPFDDCPDIPKE